MRRTDRTPTALMFRRLSVLLVFSAVLCGLGLPGCRTSEPVDFPLRVCVEEATDARAGRDGTVAVWGGFPTAEPGGGSVYRAALLASDEKSLRPLPVPNDANLYYSGEMADFDRDGAWDLVVLGCAEMSPSVRTAFLWLGSQPDGDPVIGGLGRNPFLTVPAGDKVYAADTYGRVVALSWQGGKLRATEITAPPPEPPAPLGRFVCRCLWLGDADGDGRGELILGGIGPGERAAVYVCHEDGSGRRLVSLDEIGWVYGVAGPVSDRKLVLVVRSPLVAEGLPAGASVTQESAPTSRLVLARVGEDHAVAAVPGRDTACPLRGDVSDASLVLLDDGEVVVVWTAGFMRQGLYGGPDWCRSALVAYRYGGDGLTETARRDLEGAWNLCGAAPPAGPGQPQRLLARLASRYVPAGWSPGVYLFERRGPEGPLRTFSLAAAAAPGNLAGRPAR